MRLQKLAIPILVVALAPLLLSADPGDGEPTAAVEISKNARTLDQDRAIVDLSELIETAGACASSKVEAFPDSAPDILSPGSAQESSSAGRGRVCLCADNCCTGCPGVCCTQASLSGACLAAVSCYRLDCPF